MPTVGFFGVLGFIWSHWRKSPFTLAILGAALLVVTLCDVATPIYIGRLIDALNDTGSERVSNAVWALLTVLGLTVVFRLVRESSHFPWATLALHTMRQVASDAFARVQRYSSEWHANHFAGSTVRDITRAVWSIDDFSDALYLELVPAALVVVGVVVAMSVHWPVMGLVLATGVVAYVTVSTALAINYVSPAQRKAVRSDSKVGGALADAVTCNALVKATGAERREEARLHIVLDDWHRRLRTTWFRSIATGAAQHVTMVAVQAGLLGMALWLWHQGRATPGDVTYVLSSYFMVQGYLRNVGSQIRMLQQATNDIERVVEFGRLPLGIEDDADARQIDVSRGHIRFEEVTFAYDVGNRPVYDAFSIDIRPGERIALIGHSGSGKSTFVKLLQRLHDPDRGRVTIDGQDIARVTQESLRQSIALVPQEPILFHRSLAENISYARPGANQADIEQAARRAHADDFIRALPAGYATLVGERGIKLSGGERQRVAIARAILADCPILVLDEATSSLDSVSESYIQAAFGDLMHGRTTIVIAHRLSTIRTVDRIIVFKEGRVVEQGTHTELLARPDGYYRELYEMQAGGFIDQEAG